MDKLAMTFLQTIQQRFGVPIEDKRINLEVYIDGNTVKNNVQDGGMFWHTDRMTAQGGIGFSEIAERADYSMIVLLSSEKDWKGGRLHLQAGGYPIDRKIFQLSEAPIVVLQPRLNQAIVFQNSNSGHMVEPIEPLIDRVQRNVLIMTAQVVSQ